MGKAKAGRGSGLKSISQQTGRPGGAIVNPVHSIMVLFVEISLDYVVRTSNYSSWPMKMAIPPHRGWLGRPQSPIAGLPGGWNQTWRETDQLLRPGRTALNFSMWIVLFRAPPIAWNVDSRTLRIALRPLYLADPMSSYPVTTWETTRWCWSMHPVRSPSPHPPHTPYPPKLVRLTYCHKHAWISDLVAFSCYRCLYPITSAFFMCLFELSYPLALVVRLWVGSNGIVMVTQDRQGPAAWVGREVPAKNGLIPKLDFPSHTALTTRGTAGGVAEVQKHSNKSIPRIGTGDSTSRAAAGLNAECCGFHVRVSAPPSVINSQANTHSDVPICMLVYWRIVELVASLAMYIGGLASSHSSTVCLSCLLENSDLGIWDVVRVRPESAVGLGWEREAHELFCPPSDSHQWGNQHGGEKWQHTNDTGTILCLEHKELS